MNRLKDNRGETLIESLVSLLILDHDLLAFWPWRPPRRQGLNARCGDTDVSFSYAAGKH